jgi:hypothetical protein
MNRSYKFGSPIMNRSAARVDRTFTGSHWIDKVHWIVMRIRIQVDAAVELERIFTDEALCAWAEVPRAIKIKSKRRSIVLPTSEL